MERKFYTDEFEEFLKEKAEEYKMYPSERVWTHIHQELHGNDKRRWFFMLPALLLLLGGIGYFLIQGSNEKVLPLTANTITSNSSEAGSHLTKTDNSNGVAVNISTRSAASQVVSAKRAIIKNIPLKSTTLVQSTNSVLPLSIGVNPNDNNKQQLISNSLIERPDVTITKADEAINDAVKLLGKQPVLLTIENPVAGKHEIAGPAETSTTAKENKIVSPETTNKPASENGSLAWQPILIQPKAKGKTKFSWNIYGSVNSSYRKLEDEGAKFIAGAPTIPISPAISQDVNEVVSHKPSLGFEVGAGINYELFSGFRLKTGLQFNYNKYYIKAYSYSTETALIAADPYNRNNVYGVSSFRNFGGYTPVTLQNNYFQASIPVGIELRLAGDKGFEWYAGASFQPTYNILFNTYLISADKKNYIEANNFLRKWNLNSSFETGLGFNLKNGSVLQVAPQVRYQMKPSYISELPIKEFLLEYGLKVSIKRPFR